MNQIAIYYFSGTGNSLHVARELEQRLPGTTLIPIVSLLDEARIESGAETVGFVFPTYLTSVPAPVRQFLKKLDVSSSRYIFAVITRIGTFCVADTYVAKALKKKGKTLDASFILNMANNSPTGLKPVGDKNWTRQIMPEKIAALETAVQSMLDSIQECIVARKKHFRPGSSALAAAFLEAVMSFLTENTKREIPFYTDSTCNGCGICEKVCLANKIRMSDAKPVWDRGVPCYYCYACFNFCPVQAILVKKLYTEKNGRYFHPAVNAHDIGAQKVNRRTIP